MVITSNATVPEARKAIRNARVVYLNTVEFGLVRVAKSRALAALNEHSFGEGRLVRLQRFLDSVAVGGELAPEWLLAPVGR